MQLHEPDVVLAHFEVAGKHAVDADLDFFEEDRFARGSLAQHLDLSASELGRRTEVAPGGLRIVGAIADFRRG